MKKSLVWLSATAFAFAPFYAALATPTGLQMAQAPAPAQTAPAPTTMPQFSRDALKTMLSPIALYPDPLLAQMLPAASYPLEIVQLARWLDKNPDAIAKQDYTALDAQNWDPTVKALGRFPSVVKRMNDDLDWTGELGEAFVAQPEDVAAMIQELRALAQQNGVLKSTPQQTVSTVTANNSNAIVIEPAVPNEIYVPTYTEQVYQPGIGSAVAAGLLTFGTAVAVGAIVNNNSWNWGTGVVYPPVWGGAYRPGRPIVTGDVNIGSGNAINNGIIGNTKPWRPDPNRVSTIQGKRPDLNAIQRGGNQPLQNLQTRPNAGAIAERAQAIPRPQTRPAAANTAFSGIDRGQAAQAFANRGAASRGQIARPAGGARPAMQAGGGGPRGGAARGGGGRRR